MTFRSPSVARPVALLAALCLGLPAGIAVAQTGGTPTSESAPGLSTAPQTAPAETTPPPVTTAETEPSKTTETTPKASSLANTGSEPWLIAVAGGALLLVGGALRLRVGGLRA